MLSLKKSNLNGKGFTLIELILVIALLALLATVAIPKVLGVHDKAKDNVNKANEMIIKNALERYYAENGEYPENLDDLKGKYIDEIPDGCNYTKNDGDSYSLEISETENQGDVH